jgi:capsular exopolysaccharide synthesis family protein
MRELPPVIDFNEEDRPIDLKKLVSKYLRYWPFFIASILIFMALGYAYVYFVPKTFKSIAKIKIIDDAKESKVIQEALTYVDPNSKINLENQIEVLRSFRLLNSVAKDLNLDIYYLRAGILGDRQIWHPPFEIEKHIPEDSLVKPKEFTVQLSSLGFNITDQNGKKYVVPFDSSNQPGGILPFSIRLLKNTNAKDYENVEFKVVLHQMQQATQLLAKNIEIQASEMQSDILTLSLSGESKQRSEAILNSIINKFDQDGIADRQLVSKRTLEVIDKRFIYLSGELDSIEVGKKDYKQSNNLSYIQQDAGINLQRKSETEAEVSKLQTQISLAQLLKETVTNEAAYSLLPSDIGLANSSLNDLVSNYNQMALERERLVASVGANHPTLQALSTQLQQGKLNILSTINVYESQLDVSLGQLTQQRNLSGYRFSQLPEKEKALRSIERQQSIKENLFLMLLQKREEAAINLAVTAPSIKVIDYAITDIKPIWPKKILIYPLSLFAGIFLPFVILYSIFSLDTKINDRFEIERLNPRIPVAAEIPLLDNNKSFVDANDRSILAESFRILSTNLNYLMPAKKADQGQIIYVTSAIKGEGKTLLALNLSLAFASIEKKVLLVAADLRNPQLHTYFNIDKNTLGLADFLVDSKINLKDCIHDGYDKNTFHKVCFSGTIPTNAPVLLSGKRFEKFIEMAKNEFDYIIVDTAPTVLVTDTLLISKYADLTLFVVRAGFTDKKLIEFSKNLSDTKKLINMAYALNAVGQGKSNDYNYGYGYGYDLQKPTKPWYKRLKKVRKVKSLPS